MRIILRLGRRQVLLDAWISSKQTIMKRTFALCLIVAIALVALPQWVFAKPAVVGGLETSPALESQGIEWSSPGLMDTI